MPVVDTTSFKNAYCNISTQIKTNRINKDKANVKQLVKTNLGKENTSSWLLVINNADNTELLFSATKLSNYLPFS